MTTRILPRPGMGAALLCGVLVACGSPHEQRTPPGRWSDERLVRVLQAQDHRDIPALIVLLADTAPVVREAAALALASAQDSASFPHLLPLLKDGTARVRTAAAFALSFTSDTLLLAHLDSAAAHEADADARTAMTRAAFRAAMGRRSSDALFLLGHLEGTDAEVRTRAAATLARRPKEQLLPLREGIMQAIAAEKDPDVRSFLVLALRHATDTATHRALRELASDPDPRIRVSALRALGSHADPGFLLGHVRDTVAPVRRTALEQLAGLRPTDGGAALCAAAEAGTDPATALSLYGLAMRDGDAAMRKRCADGLDKLAQMGLGPYLQAELVKARFADHGSLDTLRTIVLSNGPAVVRQAAFEQWWNNLAKRADATELDVTYAGLYRPAVEAAFTSKDAGLVAAACEKLSGWENNGCSLADLRMLIPQERVQQVRSVLHPIRDLETLQLLDALVAARDGRPVPKHAGPSFNHPIDPVKLRTLPQGQRYRIVTTKGEIVIATDVDGCPGSSLAFDSLVTAGYYDGKAFHRVVPNFVVQGGCPRGDGYGGMPWTLRTEIGRAPFTTGSVGLASAGRDTESCQFFITHNPTPHLDGRYTRFGEVVSGMDVVWSLEVGDVMERVERVR